MAISISIAYIYFYHVYLQVLYFLASMYGILTDIFYENQPFM